MGIFPWTGEASLISVTGKKMSEFDPRGGGASNFQKCLKFKKVRNLGGQAYLGIFLKFFRFFYDGSPN